MAIAHSLKLGEITPKSTGKLLKVPKFSLNFDFNTDYGSGPADELIKKEVEKIGPKILVGHIKSRLQMIEKAISQVDKDAEKEFEALLKANNLSRKAKIITPAQSKIIDDFQKALSAKVMKLQKYLEQIVDGINKSDSMKWISEVYEAAEKNLSKALSRYQLKRAAGGRAKIVILGIITVAVAAVTIAATIATGGAALAVIVAVAGTAIAILAATGKVVTALIKTRDKLRTSAKKLKANVADVDKLIKQCEDAVKKHKGKNDALAKDLGLSPAEFAKIAPKGNPTAEVVFPVCKGYKNTFESFERHLKDVEMLSAEIAMSVKPVRAQLQKLVIECKYAKDDVVKAMKEGDTSPDITKKLTFVMESQAEITLLEAKMDAIQKDLGEVNDAIDAARELKKNSDKLGIVAKNISGTNNKLAKADQWLSDADSVGKSLEKAGGGWQKLTK